MDELITLLESGKSPLDEQYADLIDSAENSQDATDVKMEVKQEPETTEQFASESKQEDESSEALEKFEKDVKPVKIEEASKSEQSSPAKETVQNEEQQSLVVKDKFGTFCDLFQATVPEKVCIKRSFANKHRNKCRNRGRNPPPLVQRQCVKRKAGAKRI